MRTEIKKCFVIVALRFAFWVCPKGEFKLELAKFMIQHIEKL